MQYLKVEWIHNKFDYPVMLYSELNDDRMETRKVEVFSDGRIGIADKSRSTDRTQLGLVPVPALEEIAEEPEFVPHEITKAEFDEIWHKSVNLKPL